MSLTSNKSQKGFTIVEIIVVMTVMGTLIGLVLTTMGDLYQSSANALRTSLQHSETQNALQVIEDNLTTSSGLMGSFSPGSTPLGSDNDVAQWTFNDPAVTADNSVLLSRSYATFTDPSGAVPRTLIKDSVASPLQCASTAPVYVRATTIFFVRDQTLFRRIVAGPNACRVPDQRTSCSVNKIAANASTCKGLDAKLLMNVTKFKIDYFTSSVQTTPLAMTPANGDSIISGASTIDVSLETTTRINNRDNVVKTKLKININKSD